MKRVGVDFFVVALLFYCTPQSGGESDAGSNKKRSASRSPATKASPSKATAEA